MFSAQEYKKNIKDFRLEEPFDYLLYRPISYGIVKFTYKLPLTPNLFSLLGLAVAICTGHILSRGGVQDQIYGGLGIMLFSVIDCCDGMLARMKKNGSPFGEYIDMSVDIISNLFFFIGTFIGLMAQGTQGPHQHHAYLILVCGLFILVHTLVYNHFKNQYAFYQYGKAPLIFGDHRRSKAENRVLFMLAAIFQKFFASLAKLVRPSNMDSEMYTRFNIYTMPLWGVIAGSTHLTILALALIVQRIEYYFTYALLFANMWMILVMIIQAGVNASITSIKIKEKEDA